MRSSGLVTNSLDLIGGMNPPGASLDPKGATLSVGKLISKEKYGNVHIGSGHTINNNVGHQISNNVINHSYFSIDTRRGVVELKRLARQVAEEKEDSNLNIAILEEVQSLFNESSEDFPPSVKSALRSCVNRQRSLEECRKELFKAVEQERENGHAESVDTLKQCHISYLEASKSFRESVLLFRQLIIGSGGSNQVSIVGDNVNYINNSTTVSQHNHPPSKTSLGQVMEITEVWNITFYAGLQEGTPCWQGCRAKPDTGSDVNWVKYEILERCGLLKEVRRFGGENQLMRDASDNLHPNDEIITLTWYKNQEAITNTLDFFVIDTGPYDMLIGNSFVRKLIEGAVGEEYAHKDSENDIPSNGTLLALRTRPAVPDKEFENVTKKKQQERAKRDADRREEKSREYAEQQSRLGSS